MLAPEWIGRDEDVLGLDVAMDDALLVRTTDAVRERQEQLHRADGADACLALQERRQRLALGELHDEERVAARRPAEVEDAHERRMREAGRSVRLANHARRLPGGRCARANQLERDVNAEHERVGNPDDAHAALPELAHESVAVADHVTREVLHLVGRVAPWQNALRLWRNRFAILRPDEERGFARNGGGHAWSDGEWIGVGRAWRCAGTASDTTAQRAS